MPSTGCGYQAPSGKGVVSAGKHPSHYEYNLCVLGTLSPVTDESLPVKDRKPKPVVYNAAGQKMPKDESCRFPLYFKEPIGYKNVARDVRSTSLLNALRRFGFDEDPWEQLCCKACNWCTKDSESARSRREVVESKEAWDVWKNVTLAVLDPEVSEPAAGQQVTSHGGESSGHGASGSPLLQGPASCNDNLPSSSGACPTSVLPATSSPGIPAAS
jgi:hypothetical protein